MIRKIFLEIVSQEIPATIHLKIIKKAEELIHEIFKTQKYDVQISSRIFNCFFDYEEKINESASLKKGPRVDTDEVILQKFLLAKSIKKQDLIERDNYYFYTEQQDSIDFENYTKNNIELFLTKLSQIFDSPIIENNFAWTRPIQNITLYIDENLQDMNIFEFEPRKNITIQDYYNILKQKNIIQNQNERIQVIQRNIKQIEEQLNVICISKFNIIQENAGIYDNPNLHIVYFDNSFLKLPKELLIETVSVNQRYFLFEKDNKICNFFAFVSNFTKPDSSVANGHLLVINARLKDALFLFQKDQTINIEDANNKLKNIHFTNNFTMYDFLEKMKKEYQHLFKKTNDTLNLMKFDLTSECVKEFPELQGIIGFYLLNRKDGIAIYEQYKQQFSTSESAEINIAHNIAYIKMILESGHFPTSSKDPFGIRRSVLTILNAIIDFEIIINLELTHQERQIFDDRFKYLTKQKLNILDPVVYNTNYYYNYKKNLQLHQIQTNNPEIIELYHRIKNILKNETHVFFMTDHFENEYEQNAIIAIKTNQFDPNVINEFINNCMINHENKDIQMRRKAILQHVVKQIESQYLS